MMVISTIQLYQFDHTCSLVDMRSSIISFSNKVTLIGLLVSSLTIALNHVVAIQEWTLSIHIII
jgi:hypothetical protein